MSDVVCRKCEKGPSETASRGAYLRRVNETGVDGIWECRPSCTHKDGGQSEALIHALIDNIKSEFKP